MSEIEPIKTQGLTIPVEAAGKSFVADIEGKRFSAPSHQELTERVVKALRRSKPVVSIPFMRIVEDSLWRGEGIGIHAGTGNVLILWSDGSRMQDAGYERQGWNLPVLDEMTAARLEYLLSERARIVDEIDEIKRENASNTPRGQFPLKHMVEDAIEKALSKEEGSE